MSLSSHLLDNVPLSPHDDNRPNTKRNHANDPLEVPIGPIIRARVNKLKKALNRLVQNI